MSASIYFVLLQKVQMLDLSGMLQVFQEANRFGGSYDINFVSLESSVESSAGLMIADIKSYQEFNPLKGDIICVPGSSNRNFDDSKYDGIIEWLIQANAKGVIICSICTGAFFLAKSGLLNQKECTTHWRMTEQLQQKHSQILVQKDILFTKSNNIYTSAGFITGVDLALSILEDLKGAELAAKVAQELVVYVRRNGSDNQISSYFRFRSHQDENIHFIQNWIIENIDKASKMTALAEMVCMSPRNLSRVFKIKTGITISDYRNKIRVEKAKTLLHNSDYKLDQIALLCGYKKGKQIRELLKLS